MMTPKSPQRPGVGLDVHNNDPLLLLAGLEAAQLGAEDRQALAALGPAPIQQLLADACTHQPAHQEAARSSPAAAEVAARSAEQPPVTCRLGKYVLDVPLRLGNPTVNARLGRSPIPCRPVNIDRKETLTIHLVPEERGRRLQARARFLCRLNHPNLLRVHDVGAEQGVGFVVTDAVGNETLQGRLEGPLPPREAAAIVETLARTIDYLHNQGVYHRDVKPANVFLCSQGVPRLGGFARLAFCKDLRDVRPAEDGDGASLFQTLDGLQKKTAEELTARDVYQLSALLYRLLTGQAPVRDTSRLSELVGTPTRAPVALPTPPRGRSSPLPTVPPRRFRPDVPPELDAICLKYLDGAALDAAGLWGELRAFLQVQEQTSAGTPAADHPATCTQDGTAGHGTWPDGRAVPNLPGYEICERLGSGCSSHVYRAWDARLQRPVALKVFRSSHLDTDLVARFRTEARAVAALRHPNIVPIHEIGEYQGLPYLSLAYVEGGNLAQQAAGQPYPLRPTAELVVKLAGAVQHAHERNIVHRDLKPANILLTRDGEPMIADFGLAKRLEPEASEVATLAGTVLGTPCYMAPEQAEGRPQDVGPRTDVYALGAILYELLTGRPPFRGSTSQETLEQVRAHELTPPRKLRREVPGDLETICLTCLHKDPRQRYDSARALADDLRRFLDREPIAARPVPAWERAARWLSRQPLRLFAEAGLAAVLLLALLASLLGVRQRPVEVVSLSALDELRAELETLRERMSVLEQERDAAVRERDHWRREHEQLKNAVLPPVSPPPAVTAPAVPSSRPPAEAPEPQEEDIARVPVLLRQKPFQRDVEQLQTLVREANAEERQAGVAEEKRTQISDVLQRLRDAVQTHYAAAPVVADALAYLERVRGQVEQWRRSAVVPPPSSAVSSPSARLPLQFQTGPAGLLGRSFTHEPQRKMAP